ncbi:MAG: 2-C-methyl-D-erythritol 4-phosphate cytidylyltransferase [Porticoccaceae bacterium]|nr:2-C-methyl-D-erythritol 4-phosphate cytidylyltransferase [Porticoccaceae bacterium]
MSFWFVVPAAGVGSRFGGDIAKQYALLAGKTVIEHTLERLLAVKAAGIVVAIHPEDVHWKTLEISRHPLIRSVTGGSERVHSVSHALAALAEQAADDDWVLVHDVARPCVRVDDIQRLLETLKDSPVGGILAAPVSDTIKVVADGSKITNTQNRSTLWSAMTPQMFRYGLLVESLSQALLQQIIPTDESMAVELAGFSPEAVPGCRDNIKITREEDIAIAAAILSWQAEQLGQ